MSLVVWLPLNGRTDNQGIGNLTLNSNTATLNSNGKIGSCYQFNGSNAKIEYIHDKTIWSNKEISIAMWYKYDGSSTGNCVVDIAADLCLSYNHNSSGLRFSFWRAYSNGGTRTGDSGTASTYYSDTQWHHVVLVCDHNLNQIYVDGVLSQTFDSSSKYTTNFTPLLASGYNKITIGKSAGSNPYATGFVNDVRIYSHALSAAEIHEISQGLVLHYKLDTLYPASNTNLVTGVTKGGQTTLLTDGRIGVKTSGTNADTYFTVNLSEDITNGTTYYLCCDASGISEGATWIFPLGSQSNTSLMFYIRNGHNEMHFTANDINWGTKRLFLDDINRTDWANQASFYNFQLIKVGTGAQLEVKDNSGYGNNASVTGAIELKSDTPRYSNSCSMNNNVYATVSTISNNFNTNMYLSELTWSGWIKRTNQSAATMVIDNTIVKIHMNSSYPLLISWNHATTSSVASNSWAPNASPVLNEWTHIAFTFKDGVLKCYKNGVYMGISDRNSTGQFIKGPRGSSLFAADTSDKFIGQLSDIRTYVTALSDADIKQLYEVGAKVDNKQNIHSYEFIEQEKINITKANMHGNNFTEDFVLDSSRLHTEPDGSLWLHIFHHNNPAGSKFTNTSGDWGMDKIIDADRWYRVETSIFGLHSYEFLYIQKTTSSASETKYRWTQTQNPVTSTWTDVQPGTVTYNTTTGYSSSSMGGMYLMKNSNLHMCIANSSSGNWYGGIGCSTAYNNGIPGYPNTTVTSGCIDLYLRIYNGAEAIKNHGWNAVEIIEF